MIGEVSPQQPPNWLPEFVLTPRLESPGPGMDTVSTPRTIEEFVDSITGQLDRPGSDRPLDESPVVLRVSEAFAMYEMVMELGLVYAGTAVEGLCLPDQNPSRRPGDVVRQGGGGCRRS
jgi:hypothetical protein